MPDDEYEILPHEEIEHLRKEVDRLKASPFLHGEHGESLLNSISRLNDNIETLIAIFKGADEKMAKYYAETDPAQALSSIKQQNETLAKGMIALADLIKRQVEPETIRPRPQAPPVQIMPQNSPNAMPQQDTFQSRDRWNFESPMPRVQTTPSGGMPGPVMAPGGMAPASTPTFRPEIIDDFPTPPPPKRGFFGRK